MTYKLVIAGRYYNKNTFMGLNDYLALHHQRKARVKHDCEMIVASAIRLQLRKLQFDTPVTIHFTYYESSAKRDLDNIAGFAHKIIIDALVKCEVLKDDSQRYVTGLSDRVFIDRDNPRIVVEIEEVKGDKA